MTDRRAVAPAAYSWDDFKEDVSDFVHDPVGEVSDAWNSTKDYLTGSDWLGWMFPSEYYGTMVGSPFIERQLNAQFGTTFGQLAPLIPEVIDIVFPEEATIPELPSEGRFNEELIAKDFLDYVQNIEDFDPLAGLERRDSKAHLNDFVDRAVLRSDQIKEYTDRINVQEDERMFGSARSRTL